MAVSYRELYSAAYTQMENRSKSSVQSRLIGGSAAASKMVGQMIAKIPLVSKSPLDESLIAAGERLDTYEEHRILTAMRRLAHRQSSCVRPFIKQIDTINHVYNQPWS